MSLTKQWPRPQDSRSESLYLAMQQLVDFLQRGEATTDLTGVEGDIAALEADVTALKGAEYVAASASAVLAAERVLTSTATVAVDLATAGQAKLNVPSDAITLNEMEHGTQGDVLYYDPAPARLAAPSVRRVLTGLTGANPSYYSGYIVTDEQTASASAQLDFTFTAGCKAARFEFSGITPSVNAVFAMRVIQSGSPLSGASNYGWCFTRLRSGNATVVGLIDSSDSEIELSETLNSSDAAALSGYCEIRQPLEGSLKKHFDFATDYFASSIVDFMTSKGGGRLIANTDALGGIRFFFLSGNIASGTITMLERF